MYKNKAPLAVYGYGPEVIGYDCAITKLELNPWWAVDLLAAYIVNMVVITAGNDTEDHICAGT
jgi:hypothetical protein